MSSSKDDSPVPPHLLAGDAKSVSDPRGSGKRLGSLAKLNVSPEAIRALPSDFVKRHRILPVEIYNGTIHLATSDPGNQRVIDDVRLLTGLEVKESEAPGAEILE